MNKYCTGTVVCGKAYLCPPIYQSIVINHF
jgi:hypothetical protein